MFIRRVVAEAACNGTSQILNQIAFPLMHFNNFPRYYCLKSFGGGAILKVLEPAFKVWKKNSWNQSNTRIIGKIREIEATTLSVWRKKVVKSKQQHHQFGEKKSWNRSNSFVKKRSNTQGLWKNSWNRWIQKGIDPLAGRWWAGLLHSAAHYAMLWIDDFPAKVSKVASRFVIVFRK